MLTCRKTVSDDEADQDWGDGGWWRDDLDVYEKYWPNIAPDRELWSSRGEGFAQQDSLTGL